MQDFFGTLPSILGYQVGAPTKDSLLLLYSLCVVCSMLDENIPKRAQRCPYFYWALGTTVDDISIDSGINIGQLLVADLA